MSVRDVLEKEEAQRTHREADRQNSRQADRWAGKPNRCARHGK